MVTTLLSLLLVAHTSALPKLGADRREILASQRLLGHRALEDTGSRVVFDGGPDGWGDVSRAMYTFANNKLVTLTLVLTSDASDATNHQHFWQLRDGLAAQSGVLEFDRVRDSDKNVLHVLPSQVDETIWVSDGVDTTIAAAYGDRRSITVTVAHENRLASEMASVTDPNAPALNGPPLALAVRDASEKLLDDFGDQRILDEGAKRKGKPITVRLSAVKLPPQLAAHASGTVEERFSRFAKGDWDLAVVDEAADADVDLTIDVEPVADGYAMHLSARFARGQNQGQMLYGATMMMR